MTGTSWRRVTRWATRILLMAVLTLITVAVAVLIVIPRATHGAALTVLTGSMTPGIPIGSVVVDRPVDPGTLHVGDIATYQKTPGKPDFVTHRIVKIDTSKTPAVFTFKGDANRGPDPDPVPATAIRGKVWFHLPFLGAFRDSLHTKGGAGGVAMVLLVGYALVQVGGGLRERKRPQTATPRTPQQEPASPNRLMILATLPTREFEGLTPHAVAGLLHGILLDVGADTFTVLVAEEEPRATETIELLRAFCPLELRTATASFGASIAEPHTHPMPVERIALARTVTVDA